MKVLKTRQKRFLILLAVVVLICIIGTLLQNVATQTSGITKDKQLTIVVDAGHGGIDPGKVGINGAYEKDVNLSIALKLKEILKKKKCPVIMTRESDEGLYCEGDTNRKSADLKMRAEIMNQDEVDYIISIHQNSFAGESSHGAQVFYQSSSEVGKALAEELQKELVASLDTENHRQAKANDSYYLLKKTVKPIVIIECGFLSNREEGDKLIQEEYQMQAAEAIAKGLFSYIESGREK